MLGIFSVILFVVINYIILNSNINIGILLHVRQALLMLGNSILSILLIGSGLKAQYPELRTKPIFGSAGVSNQKTLP